MASWVLRRWRGAHTQNPFCQSQAEKGQCTGGIVAQEKSVAEGHRWRQVQRRCRRHRHHQNQRRLTRPRHPKTGMAPRSVESVAQPPCAWAYSDNRLTFYPRLAAFNINWREQPERGIFSQIPPRKGCLTKPGYDNHSGRHDRERPVSPT